MMKKTNRWTVLIIVYVAMVTFGIVYKSMPPVLTLVMENFNLSRAQGGALMSVFVFPGILLSIPGGLLVDYYGPKLIGILSFLFMISGSMLIVFSSSYASLLLGRLLSGIGGITISIMTAKALTQWFIARDFGLAMGVFHTAVPTGTVIALNLYGWMADRWDWILPMICTSVLCLAAFLLFLWKFPASSPAGEKEASGDAGSSSSSRVTLPVLSPEKTKTANPASHALSPVPVPSLSTSPANANANAPANANANAPAPENANANAAGSKGLLSNMLKPLKTMNVFLWLAAVLWLLYNASGVSFITFAPDYFAGKGYHLAYAGFIASLFMAGVLILSPVVGFVAGKLKKDEIFIAVAGIIMAMLLYMLPRYYGAEPLLWGSLIGLTAGLIPAPVFLLIPKFLPTRHTGLGFGVISTCRSIGVLVGPYCVGLSYDLTGQYTAGFTLMALFALVMTIAAVILWQLRTRQTVFS